MTNQRIWRKPGLRYPEPFDALFFDVDGILLYTVDSFHATDIATAEYVVGTLHGLDWGQHEGKPLVTLQDIEQFKLAGGFNNDWDMCYLLSSLYTAIWREWRGTTLAARTTEEWANLAREAHLAGRGGRTWVNTVVPESARLDYHIVGDIYHEYYWGAEGIRTYYGREPRYVQNQQGLYLREHFLFQPDIFQRFRASGIKHMGLITGRVGPEVEVALAMLEQYTGERWWEVVIPGDVCPKPDPRALRMAIAQTGARGGLFIGDTADDRDLVRYYMESRQAGEPEFLSAMMVNPSEIELYQQRGADLIVKSIDDLLLCLPEGVAE
uniref:Haloacid dehalogenase n=1 Tax=Thermosporothrix sp. COM3 TaxID=2490863 RepID=A0A455SPY7_9CHLR|nr:haloacid dehalogenase [Thermosporothrix sp. COM3]